MKEIFDSMREQTKNVWKIKENPYDSYWNRAMYLEIKKENDKKEDAMRKMQEIIAEAEAKWEEDFCEWKISRTRLRKFDEYMWVTSCNNGNEIFGIPHWIVKNYNVCSYCGKRIKIVEVE